MGSKIAMNMTLQFQQAKLDDVDAIADLLEYCYDYPLPALEGIKKTFDQMQDQYVCGWVNGTIQSALRNIPLQQYLRGSLKTMGGIANVVSAPEFRRRGYINKLMIKTFEMMKEQNMCVSTLYPFKDAFYHQQGYINVGPHEFVEINPSWLSKWKQLPEGYTIVRTRAKDAIQDLKRMQELHISKIHGGVVRADWRWKELYGHAKSWVVCAYNPQQELEGILHFKPSGFGFKLFGDNNVGTLSRIEFHTTSLAATHALFHFIYLNADQIHRVNLPVYNDGFQYFSWLSGHAKTKKHLHMVNMARIIDVGPALNEISVKTKGNEEMMKKSLSIKVTDPLCQWNNGVWELHIQDGKLYVTPSEQNIAENEFTIEGLTALLYGTMSLEEIQYYGWASKIAPESLSTLKAWFPQMQYCNTEFF